MGYGLNRVSCTGIIFLVAAMTAPAQSQEINVQAGQTDVKVNERGVEVDADPDRSDRIVSRPDAPAAALDKNLADWLIIDQRATVELAKFGLQRTKTPEVRELIEEIVRDHQQLIERLAPVQERKVNASSSTDNEAAGESTAAEAPGQERRRQRSDRPLEQLAERVERIADRAERTVDDIRGAIERNLIDSATRSGSAWTGVQLHREITDQLVEQSKQNLDKRAGYEFDASLIGILVANHLRQEATVKVFRNRADDDLRQVLGEALTSVRQHRQRAEQVMETIKPER